jgi:hypothetical protein
MDGSQGKTFDAAKTLDNLTKATDTSLYIWLLYLTLIKSAIIVSPQYAHPALELREPPAMRISRKFVITGLDVYGNKAIVKTATE